MPTTTSLTVGTAGVSLSPQLEQTLLTALKAYAELYRQRAVLDAALQTQREAIGALREETGQQSLSLDGFSVIRINPVRSILDKKKLVELGVSMAIIEQATVTKPQRGYDRISLPDETVDPAVTSDPCLG